MVYVPAGEFIMGTSDEEIQWLLENTDWAKEWQKTGFFDREQPQHTVYLGGFWIDQTEVTNEQYGLCVAAGACQALEYADDGHLGGADQPVEGASWHDAQAYCKWLSEGTGQEYRLPTEAEWEKAARGTDARKYPWGNAFDGAKLNFCDANCTLGWKDSQADDGYQYTAPVGSYLAGESPYGALDMVGNVWELTGSLWGEKYASPDFRYPYNPEDGREDLEAPDGVRRVLRGASWINFQGLARCACRSWYAPELRVVGIGFRVVASPQLSVAGS